MLRRIAPVTLVLVAACAIDGGAPRDDHEQNEPPIESVASALTDADPVSVAVVESCTTASVKGLATQLVDEIQCMRPGTFTSLEGAPGFDLRGAVFPWLQTPATEALRAAQRTRGVTMTISSALRTLPQQYLLYRWYQTKRCNIGLAATPGKSNHESALSVDIEDNAGWRPAMTASDFTWFGASDPVHFDFTGEKVDIGGLSVLSFQRLWNRNHPDDLLEEDSAYGNATEERLAKSPVGGFPRGAECTSSKGEPPTPDDGGVGGGEHEGGVGVGGGVGGGTLGGAGDRADRDGQGCVSGGRPTDGFGLALAVLASVLVRRRRAAR